MGNNFFCLGKANLISKSIFKLGLLSIQRRRRLLGRGRKRATYTLRNEVAFPQSLRIFWSIRCTGAHLPRAGLVPSVPSPSMATYAVVLERVLDISCMALAGPDRVRVRWHFEWKNRTISGVFWLNINTLHIFYIAQTTPANKKWSYNHVRENCRRYNAAKIFQYRILAVHQTRTSHGDIKRMRNKYSTLSFS